MDRHHVHRTVLDPGREVLEGGLLGFVAASSTDDQVDGDLRSLPPQGVASQVLVLGPHDEHEVTDLRDLGGPGERPEMTRRPARGG